MIRASFSPPQITSSVCPTRIQSYSPSPEPNGAPALNTQNVLILHPSGTKYCTRTSGFSSVGCIAHCDVLLFSSLYWHAEFVNTGKKKSIFFFFYSELSKNNLKDCRFGTHLECRLWRWNTD